MYRKISQALSIRFNIIKNLLRYHTFLSLDTYKVKTPRTTHSFGFNKIICVKGAKIQIGENVTLNSKADGYHGGMPYGTTLLVDVEGGCISIGDNCRINGAYIHAKKEITIGRNCVIAAGANILDSNGHLLLSSNRTQDTDEPQNIKIGDNVWICMNSIILKGTTIGNNSVVAANSVVKGSFGDNCVIQGNPAKVISILPIK